MIRFELEGGTSAASPSGFSSGPKMTACTGICHDERFGRVWRGSYSFARGGFWWSRTLRGLRNVLG